MNEQDGFMLPEKGQNRETNVEIIASDGLGYGEGTISRKQQLDSGELDQSSLDGAIEIIHNDPDVFVTVDTNDDGCGDGRGTLRAYRLLDASTGQVETYERSRRRAKLFGGGLVVASSMWRAIEGATNNGQTLSGDRTFLADELRARNISYGAHTDTHASGDNCGCGAIDKYETISRNITKFRESIDGTLKALYGENYTDNIDAINSVFTNYEAIDSDYFTGTTGRKTMDFIESTGAVIKELEGSHKEDFVVINDVEDTALDQQRLKEKLQARGLSPDVQAFAVDVWRGKMYADLVADIAEENGLNRDDSYKKAYADFLIRTCATSATLTVGDQLVLYRSAA